MCDLRELSAGELQRRVRVAGARAASFSPHVARVHPAKLVAGLAATVEDLGVRIYERTPVLEIRPREAQVLGEPGALSTLPWVGRAPRRWEPEPLRWSAIHAVYGLYRAADQLERRSGRQSLLGRLVDRPSGRV
jgi:glycine/D-amino acid oxidase-like deaminating enzyme